VKNLWLKYTLYRLGLFAVLVIILRLLMPIFFAILVAGMLSFAISIIFLSKLRDEISKQIYEKRQNTFGSGDRESDLENSKLDALESNAKKTPAKPKGK
jgi:ABC-type bacteriocin/lantibiotic exporter with double-glycine peptidase domain